MTRFLWVLGCFISAICATVCLTAVSPVWAQERPKVELVSINRGEAIATVRVHEGARLHDVNTLARRYARVPGLHVDMEMITARNPGKIIFVCFDNMRGERPFMSRNPASVEDCVGYRSTRWLLGSPAGVTYVIPLVPETVPELAEVPVAAATPVDVDATVPHVVSDPADRERIVELERQIAVLRTALQVEPIPADERSLVPALIAILTCLLIVGVVVYRLFFLLRLRWQSHVMKRVHRLNSTWSRYANFLYRTLKKTESEHAHTQTLFGRRRKRTSLLLVQLAKYRKLLRECLYTIKNFQGLQSEEIACRERLPKLLNQMDQAQVHQINASNARARSHMVLHWLKFLRSEEAMYPKALYMITVRTYRRMLADYRKDRLRHEAQIQSCADAKTQASDDLCALTGVRLEDVFPKERLRQAAQTANQSADIMQAQTEALNDIIQAQISLYERIDAREAGVEMREQQVATAEAELVERLKAYELKQTLDAWTGGLAKVDTTDAEDRMSLLEIKVRGLTQRADETQVELDRTNTFLEDARKEFSRKSEIIDAIERGPDHQAKLILQMTAYIADMESELGIKRKSVFAGLPAIGYGDAKPKSRA